VELPPELLAFEIGPYGKPALGQASGDPRVEFSLSHSHGVGVLAVGLEDELGIDIERLRPFDDAMAIAKRLFTAEEQRVLRALPEPDRPGAFFRYWTGKEAVVKSVGRGLSQPLDGFGLRLDGATPEQVDVDCGGVSVARWVLSVPPLREGFVAALATAGAPPTVHCREWLEE
jgi:4'-phosphopantetheinyl transferase